MMQMKIKDDYEVPLMATSSANAAASQYMGHGQDQQLAQGHYLQKHIWQNTNITRGAQPLQFLEQHKEGRLDKCSRMG